ncbi:helix-turn-helix domain-containing protein [Mucilaginibacter sp. cycad4]|uniref:AraC family transcriptional regulator n=1 Tax=Mucilaginibacter sp. cycad4 TaxID=3342096 RepID=UPI002AABFE42|nr:helix-turn-helix domain-containing protein [Mucilaginibacter gossypii]WPV01464.1 helix-turn-helix domain-containing protein [Mucilaginibacter gossypii]
MDDTRLELTDQNRQLLFSISPFSNNTFPDFNRFNTFSVMLVMEGEGTVVADFSEYNFNKSCLICFSLYQAFCIKSKGNLKGVMINFHPDFFCLHQHRHEVSCNGILFNNIYESPVTDLSPSNRKSILTCIDGMRSEMQQPGIAQSEVLLSYLKILLINASGIKIEGRKADQATIIKEPQHIYTLKEAIEKNFRSYHRPGDYARLLNTSITVLNNISKRHFYKNLSDLITERVITETKRELYLTAKPVKLIAHEMGFTDEFYFSRYFKKHAGVSPLHFRDAVGFNKGNS